MISTLKVNASVVQKTLKTSNQTKSFDVKGAMAKPFSENNNLAITILFR